jgi:DNA-binding CsgD family transcriptional regulator
MADRLRTDYEWTPRQRQVLDLLTRGRTNGEIGQALGITLDGAKWHVAEVMSKLGATTREEAAEYWRAYNGLGRKFERVFRGVVAAHAVRWIVAGAGMAGLGAAAAIVVLIVARGGDTRVPADATAPATATVETATPGGATPTPTTTPDASLDALMPPNAIELQWTDPVPLPAGVVVYFYGGNLGGEGTLAPLRRAYRIGDGPLVIEELSGTAPAEGPRYSIAMDEDQGRFAVVACVQGDCGYAGYNIAAAEDAGANIFLSDDGAVTWRNAGDFPLNSVVIGFVGDQLLASTFALDGNSPPRTWWYPSGQDVARPPVESFPVIAAGELLWQTRAGDLVDSGGKAVWTAPRLPLARPAPELDLDAGGALARWGVTMDEASHRHYLAEVDESGTAGRAFWVEAFSAGSQRRLSADLVLANAFFDSLPGKASLFDLRTGAVAPLAELVRPGERDAFAITAAVGPFAKVTGTGDCLNVRAEPAASAQSLGCFRDGVLLRDRGETREAGGITWAAVSTPAGDGWASTQYLER